MRQTSNTKDLGALSSYLSSVLVEWRPETGQHTPQAAESHSVAVQAYEHSSLDGQIVVERDCVPRNQGAGTVIPFLRQAWAGW